jgi:hypothetical protein
MDEIVAEQAARVARSLVRDPMLRAFPFEELQAQAVLEYAATLSHPSFYRPRPPRVEEVPERPYSRYLNHYRYVPATAERHVQIDQDWFRIVHRRVRGRVKDALLKAAGWKLRHVVTSGGTTQRRWLPPPAQEPDHAGDLERQEDDGRGHRRDRPRRRRAAPGRARAGNHADRS